MWEKYKIHPGGPGCTYKGIHVPCYVTFAEIGGMSAGEIFADVVLKHARSYSIWVLKKCVLQNVVRRAYSQNSVVEKLIPFLRIV
jgi:hypothetical protein